MPGHDRRNLHRSYLEYLARTGRGNTAYWTPARTFFARWPDPAVWATEPLPVRLAANGSTRPLITFLILHGGLRPGYDYLLERKFSSIWREVQDCQIGADLTVFCSTAAQLGFAERVQIATASQVPARLLIQTGRPLNRLTDQDIDAFTDACIEREERTGKSWRHYEAALSNTRRVLFHLQVLPAPTATTSGVAFADRLRGATPPVRAALVAYLQRKRATCTPKTVSSLTTRLMHFGVFLARIDPALRSTADLQRRQHIEPYLSAQVDAVNAKTNQVITVAERSRRVLALAGFLTDITEWGWPDAPARRLIFRDDIPKLPKVLPRYLPVDADRRLTEQLQRPGVGNELAACALRLQRACGLRIGELLDLELDCVHEVGGQGAWLKVPLGKLESERMVPLDEDVLDLIDHIIAIRSAGQPLPHPRYRRRAQFLFTHHGRRLSQNAVRDELQRAARAAGLEHTTPHQLRHTYATALVNAGVSLQALMALLGHVSAEMSLRYGRLFDTTIRDEYERALTLAKQRAGLPTNTTRTSLPLTDITRGADWKTTPLIKSRLAGGFCLRAPAQGACTYANICEHCPSFHSDAGSLAVLTAQRVDAHALAQDAEQRGWITETERHHKLIARLDTLIEQAQAG